MIMSMFSEFKEFAVRGNVIDMAVKAMNALNKKEAAAPAAPSNREVLLGEIRDLLKGKTLH